MTWWLIALVSVLGPAGLVLALLAALWFAACRGDLDCARGRETDV